MRKMLSTMKPRRGGGGGTRIDKKTIEEKYSIKNLIFMPPKPSYVIPVETEGHKVFSCVDCGDRFVCESSYNYHVNRRSVKITYTCRNCSKTMVYLNRCNLLSHIRSHVHRTATINLVDLKIEPIPLDEIVYGLFHLGESLTMEQVLQKEQLRKNNTEPSSNQDDNDSERGSDVEVITVINEVAAELKEKPKRKRSRRKVRCMECDALIPYENGLCNSRAKHYMTPDYGVNYCSICTHKAPSSCAIKAHIRIHMNDGKNCYCPECGEYVQKKHGCKGFRQTKVSAWGYCPVQGCGLIQAIKFRRHFLDNHVRPVYKCSLCDTACLTEAAVQMHLQNKHPLVTPDVVEVNLYYQCSLCKGRLVLKQCLTSHVESHKKVIKSAYPCKRCNLIATTVTDLINHQSQCNADVDKNINTATEEDFAMCLVTKRCMVCHKDVIYKCKRSRIPYLPAVCPNNCISENANTVSIEMCNDKVSKTRPNGDANTKTDSIKCPLCPVKLSTVWSYIKMHFSTYHQTHVCIDPKLTLVKLDTTRISPNLPTENKKRRVNSAGRRKDKKRKNNNNTIELESKEKQFYFGSEIKSKHKCGKCGDTSSDNAESFKTHILTHRDPSNAYQCMECGCSFAVKPSFCTHLFVAHGIKEADLYIETEKCFNEDAFKADSTIPEEPLKENQCKICREEFNNEEELNKHFRVHGMAFLMTKKLQK